MASLPTRISMQRQMTTEFAQATFNLFKRFARFNRYAPFKPPPLSSPATRGRTKEGV